MHGQFSARMYSAKIAGVIRQSVIIATPKLMRTIGRPRATSVCGLYANCGAESASRAANCQACGEICNASESFPVANWNADNFILQSILLQVYS
jgi:hypothetical protein